MSGWASRRPNRPKSRISDSLTGPARETQGSFHAIALRRRIHAKPELGLEVGKPIKHELFPPIYTP